MIKMFTTDTCGSCKLIKAYFPHIDVHVEEVLLSDDTRDQFKEHNVTSAPTLLFYKDDEIVHRHEGYISQGKLMEVYHESLREHS